MKTLPKLLLIVSAVSFAASLTAPGLEIWFGILRPISALAFVVAFIVHVVANLDPKQYEADQRLRNELLKTAPEPVPAPVPALECRVAA